MLYLLKPKAKHMDFIQKMHSGWAYVALILLAIATINAIIGLSSKNPFTPKDRRISLFALIAVHVQLVIGLILYFTSPNGFDKLKAGIGNLGPTDRLLALEHPAVNILAIVLITVGWSMHKRTADEKKFKTIAIFYALGLIFLLSRIPWQLWFA
jgi:heme A synthase